MVPHAMNSATSRSPAAVVWPVLQAPARRPTVPEVTEVVCVGVAGVPTAVTAIRAASRPRRTSPGHCPRCPG